MAGQETPETASPNDGPHEIAKSPTPPKPPRRNPAFGSMRDVTTIAPGVDLTEPACPEWADLIDEKYG
jgi:hypothetical protein